MQVSSLLSKWLMEKENQYDFSVMSKQANYKTIQLSALTAFLKISVHKTFDQ